MWLTIILGTHYCEGFIFYKCDVHFKKKFNVHVYLFQFIFSSSQNSLLIDGQKDSKLLPILSCGHPFNDSTIKTFELTEHRCCLSHSRNLFHKATAGYLNLDRHLLRSLRSPFRLSSISLVILISLEQRETRNCPFCMLTATLSISAVLHGYTTGTQSTDGKSRVSPGIKQSREQQNNIVCCVQLNTSHQTMLCVLHADTVLSWLCYRCALCTEY